MNDDRTLDAAARAWLQEGPTQSPVHALEGALAQIETMSQERRPWIPFQRSPWRPFAQPLASVLLAIVVVGATLAILARSGGVGGDPTPSPTPSQTATPGVDASPSVGPGTPAPTADPAACALVTNSEAERFAGIMGLGAVSSPYEAGNAVGCLYSDVDFGDVILRVTLTRSGGADAFDSVRVLPGVEPAAGLGDDALHDPALNTLHVLEGDVMLSIVAGKANESAANRLIRARSIAEAALPRL